MVGSPDIRHYCTDNNSYYVLTSTFNVTLDFGILVLPLSIVWTLKLSRRPKIGLSAIFILGDLYVSNAPIITAVCKCSFITHAVSAALVLVERTLSQ